MPPPRKPRTRLEALLIRQAAQAKAAGKPYYMNRAYRCARRMLRGITEALKARHWSSYRHPAGKSGGGGWKRGSKVHDEMTWVVHLGRKVPRDPLTSTILKHLAAIGLRPVATEVVVAFHGRGTACDLLCQVLPGASPSIGPAGGLVLVETKTGMGHCFTTARGTCDGLLQRVPNSPLTHAAMQLLVTAVMFKHTFPGRRLGASPRVLQVDAHTGARTYPLPGWAFREGLDAAVDFLAAPLEPRAAKRQRR
jgi:hypothetical protein